VTAFGRSLSVSEWSEETGMSYQLIWNRCFKSGWDAERALTQEARHWPRRGELTCEPLKEEDREDGVRRC
jgi:hypothetical protein